MSAAVLGGQSMPASFEGTGMPALEEDEYYAQFQPMAASGIVYTPPQLSDHVATSLLLHGVSLRQPLQETTRRSGGCNKDAGTKKCQPHQAARRITDFFSKKRDSGTAALEVVAPEKRKAV